MRFVQRSLVALATVAGFAGTAQAQDIHFFFGTTEVATLSMVDGTDFVFSFAGGPSGISFVNELYFSGPSGTFTDSSVDTTATGTFCPAPGCNIAGERYDWVVSFPTANTTDRLTAGEEALFSITTTSASDFGLPAGVQLNAFIGEDSIRLEGCVTDCAPIAAIPEPETYALMLGGLGLVGYMARRRRTT